MPFELSTLAVVPAGVNLTVRGIQTTYELQSVPAETQALFKHIASMKVDILKAREKRVILAKTCEPELLQDWDRSVNDTEAALLDLEKLLEPARLDINHNNGKLRLKTKVLWVLRDSTSLSARSDRLLLAHNRMLNTQLTTRMEHDQQLRAQRHDPPPYPTNIGIMKCAADKLEKDDADPGRALADSLHIVKDEERIPRPCSPAKRTASPRMSNQRRVADPLLVCEEEVRARTRMHPVNTPEEVVEMQSAEIVGRKAEFPARRTASVSLPLSRSTISVVSLPHLVQSSELCASARQRRPQTIKSSLRLCQPPNSCLSLSPPRSPSPFREEVRLLHREVMELEAIPAAVETLSPGLSAAHLERQHQDLAMNIYFGKSSQEQAFPSPHDHRRRSVPRPSRPISKASRQRSKSAIPHTSSTQQIRSGKLPPSFSDGKWRPHIELPTLPISDSSEPYLPADFHAMSAAGRCRAGITALPSSVDARSSLVSSTSAAQNTASPPSSNSFKRIAVADTSTTIPENPDQHWYGLKHASNVCAGHKQSLDVRRRSQIKTQYNEAIESDTDGVVRRTMYPFSADTV